MSVNNRAAKARKQFLRSISKCGDNSVLLGKYSEWRENARHRAMRKHHARMVAAGAARELAAKRWADQKVGSAASLAARLVREAALRLRMAGHRAQGISQKRSGGPREAARG